ncbi:MAG: hypothetical protein ACM359_20985 [Bacillota bacterium]
MDKATRATIERIRRHGFRVLFQCNPDTSLSVAAISPARQLYIVQGKLCDDSRLVAELARMVGVDREAGVSKGGEGREQG